jgi:hypothetical protein
LWISCFVVLLPLYPPLIKDVELVVLWAIDPHLSWTETHPVLVHSFLSFWFIISVHGKPENL